MYIYIHIYIYIYIYIISCTHTHAHPICNSHQNWLYSYFQDLPTSAIWPWGTVDTWSHRLVDSHLCGTMCEAAGWSIRPIYVSRLWHLHRLGRYPWAKTGPVPVCNDEIRPRRVKRFRILGSVVTVKMFRLWRPLSILIQEIWIFLLLGVQTWTNWENGSENSAGTQQLRLG